jgi:putative ABC transport system ATP-binding protein
MAEEIIKLNNITKTYYMGSNTVNALKSLDLCFEQGDYAAIMGPSGSGKSTLLNILGCLDQPTKGSYHLDGQDVSCLDDYQLSIIRGKKIGFVFQSFNLISQLNILENIEVPMFYQKMPQHQSKERATELARLVGLQERLKHKPFELSGGQQQRVAIARALANDPPIILADEPTGNLDQKSGQEILEILEALNANGKTVIIVTHDGKIASRVKSVVKMIDGRLDSLTNNHRN